jgi:hypothetical protein
MALIIDADTEDAIATFYGSATNDDYYSTYGGWLYVTSWAGPGHEYVSSFYDGSTNYGIISIQNAAGADQGKLGFHSYLGNFIGLSTGVMPLNEWFYVGVATSANNGFNAYSYTTSAGWVNWKSAALGAPVDWLQLRLGRVDGSYRSQLAKYAYWRAWTGGTDDNTAGELSSAQLNTERQSASIVISTVGSSGKVAHWPFNNSDSDTNGGGFTMVRTGATLDTSLPTFGSATARGAPFGNRSTAFNGGRVFTGPIY